MASVNFAFNLTREKSTATEVYTTSFNTALSTAYPQFLGGMTFVGGALRWQQPATQQHTGLWCSSVSFEHEASIANLTGQDGEVFMVVQYSSPDIDEDTQAQTPEDREIATISVDVGGSMLQLGKGSYTWSEGSKNGDKLSEDDPHPFKLVAHNEISLTIKNKETVDWTSLTEFYGKINEEEFVIPLFGTIPANRCLFESASGSREYTSQSYAYWHVTYKFSVRGDDWNKFWDGEQYSSVNQDTFTPMSFTGLFTT
ncbi:hypothetical protein Pla110_33070 [Polystyrenella longa]|uniref:Uncharacterized protein n=1 Tax=Polystyrenella longa TaxID=2528007 RepID=A0A518CQT0_9PLAN|nr:hypothetical protein [Polystyrenella longa]QDU81565.1 hypothetical protein Pla110_33070 [Polystyrenella longa]